MQKIKKPAPVPKEMKMKTCCQNIWKTLMIMFKKYSNGKNFNSSINKFDHATNEEDKEKVVKELKDINNFVNHEIFIMNEDSEYKSKLIGIANVIDYFLDEYSKKNENIKMQMLHF